MIFVFIEVQQIFISIMQLTGNFLTFIAGLSIHVWGNNNRLSISLLSASSVASKHAHFCPITVTSHSVTVFKSPAANCLSNSLLNLVKQQRKHQSFTSLDLCEWNAPVTDGFPSGYLILMKEAASCHDVIICNSSSSSLLTTWVQTKYGTVYPTFQQVLFGL